MVKKQFAIGVDIGGTFTDLLVMDEVGTIHIAKVPSTPQDPSQGAINGLKKMAGSLGLTDNELLSETVRFVHGTTIATNALIQREGANIALITTKGFKDNLVKEVIEKVDKTEYKRRQAPPGIKITPKAFSKDRRMPITNKFSN